MKVYCVGTVVLILNILIGTISSSCVCTDWSCDGYNSNSTQFRACVQNNSLWSNDHHCNICTTCIVKTCTCGTQSTCDKLHGSTGLFWWIAALSGGGFIFAIFICAIIIYIAKFFKEDHETQLAKIIQLQDHKSQTDFEEYQTEAEDADESETYEEPSSSYNGDKSPYHLQTPLKIVINPPQMIQTIPNYSILYKDKHWNDIDVYTKYLVVGFISKYTTQLAFVLDDEYIIDIIHLITICFYDNSVCFDTYTMNKDFVMSSNGFCYGAHEWILQVTHSSLHKQEIGIVSNMDINIQNQARRLSGEDLSVCDISQFGARTVYGRDDKTFYYASYNENNFERCQVDLRHYHKCDYWNKGDQIRIYLNIKEQSIQFFLNGKKVRKRIKIQKNKRYFPIISYYGRFRCKLLDYK